MMFHPKHVLIKDEFQKHRLDHQIDNYYCYYYYYYYYYYYRYMLDSSLYEEVLNNVCF